MFHDHLKKIQNQNYSFDSYNYPDYDCDTKTKLRRKNDFNIHPHILYILYKYFTIDENPMNQDV